MNTLKLISEYEGRLSTGWGKLRALELNGQWNDAMYTYYLEVEDEYKQLCKPPFLFGLNEAVTKSPHGSAKSG